MGQKEELKALYDSYVKDSKFDTLRKDWINFVPGSGPLSPKLMLVGEAPGRMENARRQPFIGTAGVILVNLLQDVGIDPYEVFMTNIVKYWPQTEKRGQTRTPTEEEIKNSQEYLLHEIGIVDPLFVGICGKSALQAIFPEQDKIYTCHGQLLEGRYIPLYHPAVVAHNPTRKHKVREGYVKLKAYMDTK